ncbi:hypothetical protein [Microcoleus sp. B3-A4]
MFVEPRLYSIRRGHGQLVVAGDTQPKVRVIPPSEDRLQAGLFVS